MKSTIKAEVHVLDRILYLLEEDSVSYLAGGDDYFADFIDQLYSKVQVKAGDLRETGTKSGL